jgi:ubiquitin-protein ligase
VSAAHVQARLSGTISVDATAAHSVPGISAVPHEDNLRYFDVEIHGPTQSPYEGSRTKLPIPLKTVGLTHNQAGYSSLNCFCRRTIP